MPMPSIERLVNRAEQAIDELEQAAFIASLVPDVIAPDLLGPLADAVRRRRRAAPKPPPRARPAPPTCRKVNSIDSEDALAAVGRLIEAEHKADAAERAVTAIDPAR